MTAEEETWTSPETWRLDMASFITSGDDTDVEIYVEHRTFHAHSQILRARPPYLKGMLASSMREADTKEIKETEMDPDTFEVLLRFMYTDSVDDGAVQAKGEDLYSEERTSTSSTASRCVARWRCARSSRWKTWPRACCWPIRPRPTC